MLILNDVNNLVSMTGMICKLSNDYVDYEKLFVAKTKILLFINDQTWKCVLSIHFYQLCSQKSSLWFQIQKVYNLNLVQMETPIRVWYIFEVIIKVYKSMWKVRSLEMFTTNKSWYIIETVKPHKSHSTNRCG